MDYEYKTRLESELEKLEEITKEEENFELFESEFSAIKEKIRLEKEKDLSNNIDFVKRGIKRDILTRLYGESAVYEHLTLKSDPYVMKAVEILSIPEEYSSILTN